MPAQEDCYRPQRVLHVVFAVSSVAMLFSIVWMIGADHMREWREVQRYFTYLDAAKAQKEDTEDYEKVIDELRDKLAEARAEAEPKVEELESGVATLLGNVQRADQALSFAKAERDSIASLYTIAIEEGHTAEANEHLERLEGLDDELLKLRQEAEDAQRTLDEREAKIAEANEKVTEIQKQIVEAEKAKDRLQAKKWTWKAAARSLPILDAFAPATKIQQVALDDLKINYSFKDVGRFDRCTTCHMAIDSVKKDGSAAFPSELVDELGKDLVPKKYKDAFKTHPRPQIFCGPNSPHPREKFGCTICHEGQGSGTTFVFSSHSPNSLEEEEKWESDYDFHEIHHWPYKMLRSRFAEASCLKCHVKVVDLEVSQHGNAAEKLVRGYHLIRQYGCFGCHEINGYLDGQQIGPDMRLEPQTEAEREKATEANPAGRMRKVGPSFRRLHEKTNPEWTALWIKLPKGFRPTTRMPQFYGLPNNDGVHAGSDPKDPVRANIEAHAITQFLFDNSRNYATSANLAALSDPPVPVDSNDQEQTARGKNLFLERGCLACHTHKEITAEYPEADADFGPDLSNVAEKLKDEAGKPNSKWLFHWIKQPTLHHPRTKMPDLQMADQDVADIAAWLLSIPGAWAEKPQMPAVDEEFREVLDGMIRMYLVKSMTLNETATALTQGIPAAKAATLKGDEKLLAAPITLEKKLTYIGSKTVGRMGCFGCHDIPGFESMKPIGTALSDWGKKARLDPDKLAFEHIVEYLEHEVPDGEKGEDFELFFDGIKHHKGESFIWQKLRDPRSYDYKMLRQWDERLRMPKFPFADNQEDVEAVMTFVLGLLADGSIPAHYRNLLEGPALAKVEGERLVTQFNCRGCHVTKMPKYVFTVPEDLPAEDPQEFDIVKQYQASFARDPAIEGTEKIGVHGLLVGQDAPPLNPPGSDLYLSDDVIAVQLWEPVKIGEKTIISADQIAFEAGLMDWQQSEPAHGGSFAGILAKHLAKSVSGKSGRDLLFRVPPPLVREGYKVQPDWLYQFLLDPIPIRPAAVLRMPKFNMSRDEAGVIADYFAAVDGAVYPYEYVEQRDNTYLARKEAGHDNYLEEGFKVLTLSDPKVKLCANCHSVGNVMASGQPDEKGPDLWLTRDRLRPEWLLQWLASPKRLLPFTGMPNNFVKGDPKLQEYFKGTSLEQVTALRDALINYHSIQQRLSQAGGEKQSTAGGN